MTDANYTDITILLDRSGSMQSIKGDTEGGLNSYIESLVNIPGRVALTLYQFDDQGFDTVLQAHDIHSRLMIPPIRIQPRGQTPLLDSQALAIMETGVRLRNMPQSVRPGKVIFVTITDGMENASTKWNARSVADMVKHQREEYRWEFIYMGANQDAFAQAADMGIRAGGTFAYAINSDGIRKAYGGLRVNTANYVSGQSNTMDWTDAQKDEQDEELKITGSTFKNKQDKK